jgi:hypothetical protein
VTIDPNYPSSSENPARKVVAGLYQRGSMGTLWVSRSWTTTEPLVAKKKHVIMTQIRNPHPGKILKEEFKEIGMSQNGLAHAIGNRIHAIVNGMRDITGDTDPRLCTTFCGCKMPMTRWKRNAKLPPMSPRSSPPDRKRLPSAPSRALRIGQMGALLA